VITRLQWVGFCWNLYNTKKHLGSRWGDITLHGRPIESIDLLNYYIYTVSAGEPRRRYSFEESLRDNLGEGELYRSVRVTTDFERLFKFRFFRFGGEPWLK
jgi:hypothetical protein